MLDLTQLNLTYLKTKEAYQPDQIGRDNMRCAGKAEDSSEFSLYRSTEPSQDAGVRPEADLVPIWWLWAAQAEGWSQFYSAGVARLKVDQE